MTPTRGVFWRTKTTIGHAPTRRKVVHCRHTDLLSLIVHVSSSFTVIGIASREMSCFLGQRAQFHRLDCLLEVVCNIDTNRREIPVDQAYMSPSISD